MYCTCKTYIQKAIAKCDKGTSEIFLWGAQNDLVEETTVKRNRARYMLTMGIIHISESQLEYGYDLDAISWKAETHTYIDRGKPGFQAFQILSTTPAAHAIKLGPSVEGQSERIKRSMPQLFNLNRHPDVWRVLCAVSVIHSFDYSNLEPEVQPSLVVQ
jgi:hypothetical protein